VAGYWRWGSSRSQPWQKALALAGPPAVVALAVAALAVSGGGGSSATTNNAAASHGGGQRSVPVAAAVPTATPQRLAIGDTWHAISDGWDITVDDVTTTKAMQGGILGLPHVATGVYLAVTVTMLNTGMGAHALGDNRFKLVNAAGQSYDASAFNRSYGGGSYNEDISSGKDVNPGESLDGILFFDVPPTVSGLQFKVIGGGVFALGDLQGGRLAQAGGAPGASSDGTSTNAAPALPVSPTSKTGAWSPAPSPPVGSSDGPASPACPPSLPGHWSGAFTSNQHPGLRGTWSAELSVAGEQLSGTLTVASSGTSGATYVLAGRSSCGKITFTGGAISATGSLTPDGTSISGTYAITGDGGTLQGSLTR
jgi:hypothetical protein